MRALILNPHISAEIDRVVEYAEAHPVTRGRLTATMELDAPPIGDDPHHVVHVPVGYRCVFSFEDQPIGRCRHLSVSVDRKHSFPDAMPSLESFGILMAEFGFSAEAVNAIVLQRPPTTVFKFWIEEHHAVNVVELA